jgi:hypothetical protein
MNRAWTLLALVAPAVVASQAAAEESIFDPENPDAPEPGGETPTSESIFDPENPGAGTEVQPAASVTDPATFAGSYTLAGAMDFLRDSEGESVYELRNRLNMRGRFPLGTDSSVVLEADFRHLLLVPKKAGHNDLLPGDFDDVDEAYAPWRASLGDAFVSTRWGRLLLRVGQQRVVWGRTDLARPLDVLNPADFTDGPGSAMGADFASAGGTSPILMAKADYVGEFATAQFVLVPFFTPHRFSLLSGDFAIARPGNTLAAQNPLVSGLQRFDPELYDVIEPALVGTEIPDEVPSNASAGLRLTTHLAGLDLGAGYFFGWDRVPTIVLDPELREVLGIITGDDEFLDDFDIGGLFIRHPELARLQAGISDRAAAGHEILAVRYQRWHVLGVDAATYLGPIGVRADLAWTPERTFVTGEFQSNRRASTNAALGLSYEGDEGEVALLLEGFWLHVFPNPSDGREERPLIFGNDFPGVSLGLRVDLEILYDVPLVLQAGGIVFLARYDFILSPQVLWRVDGDTRVFVGAQIYEDPPGRDKRLTLGGLFDTNDQAFLGIEQGF